MKKNYFFLGLLLTVKIAMSQVLTEDFNYATGQLLTANGWTAHSGAGTNAITVTSPGLTYTGHPGSGVGNAVGMTTSGEDDNKAFTAINSGSVYLSFLVNISAAQSTGDYFIGLFQSSTIFPVRIYAKSDGAAGFYFGVSKGSSAVVYETTSRSFGTTYFVVANHIFNTGTTTDDVINLWVNPALGGLETAATIANITGTSADATSIGAVYLRQGTTANASTQKVDAILVGTTWASVTSSGAAVPTLSISSPLTAFGNVCTNTTAGPNSFTISGTTLTTANVDVAALTGYTYSTTAGGTYTASLSLTQAGGTFSQQVFVKFLPTAVQSYNGNIVVSGGGAASSVNAAASGAGVNTAPSVTTGTASAITTATATVAGSIPSAGCTAVTAYGIEYSLTNGFADGTGTQVASTNLTGGNYTSALSGLASATIYYYKAYATNAAGTVWGTQQTFTTANLSPSINASVLTAFGNVCVNTTPGPNSFTITGSNLTTANVDVAALAGYTYSTTSGGTYTATLSFTQPGGSFSQQVFVKFNPIAIQSYNGNIAITGGGIAAAVNVAAVGAGVNSAPSLTTGAASAITTTAATLAGSITATGCTAVTAYGIEYSLTNGFANGTGTQVVSTNLATGNFTSGLSGLTPSTVYYYKAYATNGGGTAYGVQQSFTTATPPPPVLTATALTAFGNVCVTTTTTSNSFTLNGSNLTAANISVGPLAGYTFSTTSGGTYTASLSLAQTGGTYSQAIFVKLTPATVQSYNGNIPVTGGGTTGTLNVAASGAGVNSPATVTTGNPSFINTNSATLFGTISATGCSSVTATGIEISGINGFANGTGIQVVSNTVNGSQFSSLVTGLVQGVLYYYKAYAVNSGGIAYGAQQAFVAKKIPAGFTVFPAPVDRGTSIQVSMNDLTPGYYGLLFFNSAGELVYQKNINIQSNYINQQVAIPANLARGMYTLQLVNNFKAIGTKKLFIGGQ
jgi:hypothetical protein